MDEDQNTEESLSVASPMSAETALPPREVLSLDHVYDALNHPRRRYLCYTLLEDTEWSIEELAAKIAAWEDDVAERANVHTDPERVYVSLYHSHVPKLVDDDIVTFDELSETIRPGPNAEQVLSALLAMGTTVDASQERHARGDSDGE